MGFLPYFKATSTQLCLLCTVLSLRWLTGSSFEASVVLSSLNGNNGFIAYGTEYYEISGFSVSGAGDVNGDGYDDVIIGAPTAKAVSSPGSAFVVFGGATASPWLIVDELDGTNGFVLKGISESDAAGSSVSAAGDINGDGYDDLLIGAPTAAGAGDSKPSSGETYVVFGGPTIGSSGSIELSSLDGANGFTIYGVDILDQSGCSVAGAGDFNGDDYADIIIGAFNSKGQSNTALQAGEGYVIYGSASIGENGTFALSSLDGTNGFVIYANTANAKLGSSVSNAGDVNSDGFDDVIIGAAGANGNGAAYIVFGGASVAPSGSILAAELASPVGIVLSGVDAGDSCGASVAGAGDVNNDGHDDVIIGAPDSAGFNNAAVGAGEAYVVFGGESLASFALSELDGTNGFVLYGAHEDDWTGRSVSAAGDVNHDGFADVLIGAPYADGEDQLANKAGDTYVLYGAASIGTAGVFLLSSFTGDDGFIAYGGAERDYSGYSVANVGSFRGTGGPDLAIGAYNANGFNDTSLYSGRSYVLFTDAVTPTPAPTPAPTSGPTPAPFGKFGFEADMAFNGVSKSELKGSTQEQQILITALAPFDVHVRASDIIIDDIDNYDNDDLHTKPRIRVSAASDNVEVSFYITSYLSAFGYTTESNEAYQAAYTTLSASLGEYVESGEYDAAIVAISTAANVAFEATTIPGSLDIGELDIGGDDKDDDDDDDDNGLSGGAIAGVTIASALVVAGIAGGVYLYNKAPKGDKNKPLLQDTF